MPEVHDPATRQELDALSNRVTEIVERLNEVNENGRKYVDEKDEQQTKRLTDIEKRLTELIDVKITNYDKLVRQVVVQEFAKIGK
jgi:hypothetical protein